MDTNALFYNTPLHYFSAFPRRPTITPKRLSAAALAMRRTNSGGGGCGNSSSGGVGGGRSAPSACSSTRSTPTSSSTKRVRRSVISSGVGRRVTPLQKSYCITGWARCDGLSFRLREFHTIGKGDITPSSNFVLPHPVEGKNNDRNSGVP